MMKHAGYRNGLLRRRQGWLLPLMLLLAWLGGPPAWAEEAQTEEPDDVAASDPPRGSALPSGTQAAVVRIEGQIYGFTLESLQRRIDRALDGGASLIVVELHTPGGELQAAVDISKYLKTLNVPTVAWVNRDAYSAGALIASATDQIVMARASSIGAATPVTPGGEIPESMRGKVFGLLLEEFRDNADENGYDYAILHAMVVPELLLYHIEHPETGRRHVVNEVDYRVLVRGQSIDEAQQTVREQLPADQRGESIAPRKANDDEAGQWELIRQVHDGQSALTLSQRRAIEVGFAAAGIDNEQELREHLQAASLERVEPTWSEQLAGWLTHPAVRGILVLALLLGAYIEFQSPGLGIPGAVAAVALVTLLGAPFLVGLADITHILLFALGLLLLIVELIFFAGFGVIGAIGLVLMFLGLVLMGVPTGGDGFGPVPLPGQEMWHRSVIAAVWMLGGILGAMAGIIVVARHFRHVPFLSRLVLDASQRASVAPAGGPGGEAIAEPEPEPGVSGDESLGEGRIRVGDEGVVIAGLHPGGRVRLNGDEVDVVSYGQFIDRGERVRVREVHGNRIVVDRVK